MALGSGGLGSAALSKIVGLGSETLRAIYSVLIRYYPFIADLIDDVVGDEASLTRASAATVIEDDGTVTDLTAGNVKFTDSGILIEEAHTNLIPYSRDFATGWVVTAGSVTSNDTTDPLGNASAADKYTASGASPQLSYNGITTTADIFVSCFMKKGTGCDYGYLMGYDNSANVARQWFNLNTGVVGGSDTTGGAWTVRSGSAFMVDCGNGWYWCGCMIDGAASSNRFYVALSRSDTTQDAQSGDFIYVWQMDVQDGTATGSAKYTPVETTGAAATSAQDIVTFDASSFPLDDWQCYFEYKPSVVSSDQYAIDTRAVAGTNGSGLNITSDGRWKAIHAHTSSATVTSLPNLADEDTKYKVLLTKSAGVGLKMEVGGVNFSTTGTNYTLTAANTNAYTIAPTNSAQLGCDKDTNNSCNGVIYDLKWDAIPSAGARTLEEMEELGRSLVSVSATRDYPLLTDLVDDVNGDSFTWGRAGSTLDVRNDASVQSLTTNEARYTGDGIRIEGGHENPCLRSQEFDTTWSPNRSGVTANATTDPLGTSTADRLYCGTDSTEAQLYQNLAIITGTDRGFSCFMKADDHTWGHFIIVNPTSTAGCRQWFNLSTGEIGSSTNFGSGWVVEQAGMIDVGSGWYWCWMKFSTTGAASAFHYICPSKDDLDTTSTLNKGVYLWQADAYSLNNVGDVSRPYCPVVTTSAPVSVAQDVLDDVDYSSIPTGNHQLYVEYTPELLITSANNVILDSLDGGSDGHELYLDTSNNLVMDVTKNSVQYTITSAIDIRAGFKYEILFTNDTTNGMSLSVNGMTNYHSNRDSFSGALGATGHLGNDAAGSSYAW
jgi:hypothetical protein